MTLNRGYFGIGVEESSKEGNLGNLVRSAHSFGASFFFAIAPAVNVRAVRATDTSGAFDHLPFYKFDTVADMTLPRGCALVGVELTPDAVALPSFRHPACAAYVLGPEMGSISPALQARCDHVIKIPMKFCVNVGVAGAIVMYDRLVSLGRFPARPVAPGGPLQDMPEPVFGDHRVVAAKT
jgi:tRNA G18 (ribose-2'-O)-methylase SpoU